MKLFKNLLHINFVTFMKRIGQKKGVSKHRNEHSTFSAHFSTMGRIKLREIKLSLHFVHSRPKVKVSCFQLPDPLPFLVSKIFFIHQLIRNHYVMWWSYWVLNLNEERNVVYEDHISFLQSIGIQQANTTCLMVFNATLNNISLYRGGQFYWWRKPRTRRKPSTCRKSLTNFIT
jgi:hypothetical protein